MPPGLADAVLAVIERARDVAGDEAAAIARLAEPADAVAEVQLDPPHGALAPVIGFAAAGTRALLAGAAATAEAPALTRWLDAIAPHASHWGIKLGPTPQLYARGRFEAAQAAALAALAAPAAPAALAAPAAHAALAAPAAPADAAELARLLAATGAACFSMLGIELAGAAITRHVGYVAVTRAEAAAALAAARGVATSATGGALLTEHLARLTPGRAWMHLSWDLATAAGPFKADVGACRAKGALALASRLGLDGAALAARLAALGLGDPSHVGLRAGADPERALTLYFRITAA